MAMSFPGSRLLVVEDEALVAMLIQDRLEDLGCIVVGLAGSVEKGLAVIKEHESDLDGALLDINLGSEKVYPVAAELTKYGIPFIFSTGYGRLGIDANFARIPVLTKPFSQGALESTLAQILTPTS